MNHEKERYLKNREESFKRKGIDPRDKRYNCHHILTREDKKRGRLPPDFDIDCVDNLMPILIERHNALNKYMELHPELYDDISTRVDLANLAEIGELDHYAPIQVRNIKNNRKHKK
jgi:hypothetical protein